MTNGGTRVRSRQTHRRCQHFSADMMVFVAKAKGIRVWCCACNAKNGTSIESQLCKHFTSSPQVPETNTRWQLSYEASLRSKK